jgi:hypothetical protein
VRESIRLEKPLDEVYRFWRRQENLPDALSVDAVSFSSVRNGRSTQVSAHLRSPRVREQLRRLKQVLEAGEIARTATTRA